MTAAAPTVPRDAVLSVRVYDGSRLTVSADVSGRAVELGRQQAGDAGLGVAPESDGSDLARVVIANHVDSAVSRRHVRLDPLSDSLVRVRNLSALLPITVGNGDSLGPGASADVALPQRLHLGGKVVHVEGRTTRSIRLSGLLDRYPLASSATPGTSAEPPAPFATLEERTIAPGAASLSLLDGRAIGISPSERADPGQLLGWLRRVMGVLQSAGTSKDFFDLAARATVDVAGLDVAAVVLYENASWSLKALASSDGRPKPNDWRPSRYVLERARAEKRTLWQKPKSVGEASASLAQLSAVVVSPILDRAGSVIGAVYGDRRSSIEERREAITKVEAMLVELVATGVASGLARLDQEQAALRARVMFEQFFTPELAQDLESDPSLLAGKDAVVSILVLDVRGFSRISERLGPNRTFEWIRDMMTVFSECVFRHRGVLVDYAGDELLAMWGAPREQPLHAQMACHAALEMLDELRHLGQKWDDVLEEPLDVGIGINTGPARVGNVGSERKFKYGPLGTTVNVASRVQGATKSLMSKLLVTGATHTSLKGEFPSRRLCKVRVVNIAEPVDLFEILPPDRATAVDFRQEYERALNEFEAGRFRQASQILGKLLAHQPNDGPSLVLMSRAIGGLIAEPQSFDPVWTLSGK